jgi:hypothetical protein
MAKSYPKSEQLARRRIKPTQRQKGNISSTTREQVFERSNGVCERCGSQRATQMAHIIGRRQIDHVTTAKDLLHVCVTCHKWMDETPEGIHWKRGLNDENLLFRDDEIL